MTVIDKESRHNGAIYIEIKNYLEILSKGGSVIVLIIIKAGRGLGLPFWGRR